CQHGYDAPFTF
nr:immunoglobulin light chain junction region [Macaca mulatta]MOW51471.1 immunoglobulin light chain junction region [Macaca mulatta]MOW51484.1 immunoglobulin light chain junction region [Macaca mulatta]MOW51570.1 immunoglobulin light chain junction region [Macaca mulatta]MOW51723.1 immunoglobulin light chain junction region [Macaca mulatta]